MRGQPAIFLGWNGHGVVTVELLADHKIINPAHVTFDEDFFPGQKRKIQALAEKNNLKMKFKVATMSQKCH